MYYLIKAKSFFGEGAVFTFQLRSTSDPLSLLSLSLHAHTHKLYCDCTVCTCPTGYHIGTCPMQARKIITEACSLSVEAIVYAAQHSRAHQDS